MEIVVSYEEASKRGDMSALTCFKPKNNNEFEMVVGAVSNEADEIFKIVSKQGYLKNHDSELLDKVAEIFPKSFCTYCNQEACDGGMVGTIQECETIRMIKDVIDGIIEDMKAEVDE